MLENQYKLPSNQLLKISLRSYQIMNSYIQFDKKSSEGGGILVGRVIDESNNIVIDDVSIPMPTDRRSRNRFLRNPTGHQEFFNKKWEESNNSCFYLGEWHTHPEPLPVPSSTDLKTWKKLLEKPPQDINILFFIILGTSQLRIWQGINNNGQILIEYVASSEIEI